MSAAGAENGLSRRSARQGLAPRLVRRPVEHEHAVEMIDLVLAGSGVEPLELERTSAPCRILRLHRHGDVPLDRDEHALEREAALVVHVDLVGARRRARG